MKLHAPNAESELHGTHRPHRGGLSRLLHAESRTKGASQPYKFEAGETPSD